MGYDNVAINKGYYYIWIDSKIKNSENFEYSKELRKKYPNITLFENLENGIKYLLKIKFKITFIIVSGSFFPEFISSLKKIENKILTVPRIIIFTSELTKQKIETMEKINHSFYDIGGLTISFDEILSFLNKSIFGKELNIIRPLRREKLQTGGEFTFKQINNKYDLVGPVSFFSNFIERPDNEDIIKFDKYLIDNYGDEMAELISQIYNIDCPLSLRIKYWLRAYTLETKFYKDMNSDLMKDNTKLYLPYIKLLYSSLAQKNFLNNNVSNDLYRGALVKKEEIEYFNDVMNQHQKLDIPRAIIFSKAFMSFSLDENVAKHFMEKKIPSEKTARALYILKADLKLDYTSATNVDLEGISYFEDEREILLFPYSIYEIDDIQKTEKYYKIYLNYIGKYKEIIHFKNKSKDIESFENNIYSKQLEIISLLSQSNGLCRISIKSGNIYGSGFCCLIGKPNNKIPVLITCNHILDENVLKNNAEILVFYLKKDAEFLCKIDKYNKIYFNEKYDITIIEIEKNSDIYKQMEFMEIDDNIFNKDSTEFYKESIFIPQYDIGHHLYISIGQIIKNVDHDVKIHYTHATMRGSSGTPIISNKCKVIGYHIGTDEFLYGTGGLLKLPIQEFIMKYYS